MDCIRANIEDLESRHLLVFAHDELATLNLLFSQQILKLDSTTVFFGSDFPRDQGNPEYILKVINRIRFCMETGQSVVMLYQEEIYESLYDVLNQHYTYLGDQKVPLSFFLIRSLIW